MSTGRRFPPLIRYALVGLGALLFVSAAANIAGAWLLLEVSEEQSLGITRREVTGWFGLAALAGVALIILGVRRR